MDRSLVGRGLELEAVASLLDRAEAGPTALIVEGEAGIGKTTVLRAGVERARECGYRVLRCVAVQSEVSLPFASLGDLLEPGLDEVGGRLPTVQRRALETALARLQPREAFDRLAVSRAALAVLRALAAASALLLAIDDVQWLDPSTAGILVFALRRLNEAPVRTLLAVRTEHDAEDDALVRDLPMEHVALGPLAADELGRLIAERVDVPLTRPRLHELHAISGGNPYFALEIVRALRARPDQLGPDDPLPVPDDIATLLRARIGGLSGPARESLLLTATSPQPTAASVTAVVGSRDGIDEAMAAGVLEQEGERLRFAHPLLASVVHGDAEPATRRALHARLAATAGNPDDRAHHLAHAHEAPDEEVAEQLDAAALRAHRRGAPEAAAELQEHALRLTPPELRERRRARGLRSAEYHIAAGDAGRGSALLEKVLEGASPGPERAEVALRLGHVRYLCDDVAAAHAMFEEALAQAEGDAALCTAAEQALAFTAMLGGDIPAARGHAHAALATAEELAEPAALALASGRVALNEFLGGHGLDRSRLERAVALEREGHLAEVPVEWLPSYAYAGIAAMADDLATAGALYDDLARSAEERADERWRLTVLFARSEFDVRAGNWGRASRLATDAVERSRFSGMRLLRAWALYARALVDAHLGRVQEAREAAAECMRIAGSVGAIPQTVQITAVLGFLELSLGDPAAAHAQLGPLSEVMLSFGIAEPGVVRYMPNEVEALIGLGDLEAADRMLAVLEERARALDRISMRAAAARCRGLLAAAQGDLEMARSSVEEALVQHARLEEPFELARTLLVQGTVERRALARGAARTSLHQALELFDELGAALWSERAADELARIPGRSPASSELSETEQRVADLVTQGLSNKEIAARLYVTVRTVEAHLSKAYRKLGIHSRTELAARLGDRDDQQL
jgi:DNA-binding CsgD family transcriptional regulator/tetratricopeptide (TPR) repeat protein